MSRVLTIISGKGGVGKTTSAINIGAALNKAGKDVIVVDANLTTPNVSLHLGAPIIPISLHHVLSNRAELKDAIYEHHSGMKILPASLSLANMKGVKHEKLSEVAKQLKHIYDIIIIDSAAGLGRDAISAIEAADDILIVTQAEMPALTDALKTIKLAEEMDKNIKGVIVTRFRNDDSELKIENIEEMLETPVIAIIPEDLAVKKALRERDAVMHTYPNSKAAISYKELAAKLIGRRYQKEKEEKTLLDRILEKIGFK